MSNKTPTRQEIDDALATIERATGKVKKYTRRELEAMSPEAVAAALQEDEHAFDAFDEVHDE